MTFLTIVAQLSKANEKGKLLPPHVKAHLLMWLYSTSDLSDMELR